MAATSVILFEVDASSVPIFELECDAPRPIHVDRITRRSEPSQSMKIKARNVHFLRSDRNIESVKPRENSIVHPGVDLRRPASFPKLGERFVLEAADHLT